MISIATLKQKSECLTMSSKNPKWTNVQSALKLLPSNENGQHFFHVDIEHVLNVLTKFLHCHGIPTDENVQTVARILTVFLFLKAFMKAKSRYHYNY